MSARRYELTDFEWSIIESVPASAASKPSEDRPS
jgi:hypothetical protein